MKKYELIKKVLKEEKTRSAWCKGVNQYAIELTEFLEDEKLEINEENMLNGANNWRNYSYGGYTLIYDEDIAKRLCNNTELKITKNGQKEPNKNENWLDVQTRALYQACKKVLQIYNESEVK